MKVLFFIIGIAVLLPVIWFALSLLLTFIIPSEKSGRALIKQKTKALGVDINRIPDSAWNELVARNINIAKNFSTLSSDIRYKNWRANLVRQLERDAFMVKDVMNGQLDRTPDYIKETLIKHGVINN
ncbi:MAG: hypothetical protein WBK77_03380 [Alphaproteobacteria bacterium]